MSLSIGVRDGSQHDDPVTDVRFEGRQDRSYVAVPLREPVPRSEPAVRCVVTTADRAGRLADRSLLRHLDWCPRTSVRFDIQGDLILVVADAGSPTSITTQGHLRLPLAVRRRCRIDAGTRLLVVARPDTGTLVGVTMATVQEMVLARLARGRW